MLIKDVMTTKPACCDPADTLDDVARLMLKNDCGEIPVCDGEKVLGVITDRDITLRAVATGRTPAAVPVREVMTNKVVTVKETEKLDKALDLMQENLVRRLPVLNDDGKLVGIVSEADLVAKVPTLKVARLVRSVSRRTRGHARATI